MEIGSRITYFRNIKQYTVNKLATKAGISQSYLRDVELGNKKPTVEVLSYICQALNISLSDFFDDQTQNKLSDDPLLTEIYKLNSEQRSALRCFLNTLTK
jgi:transcriptional regulator with XRE-family HTH domain